MFFIASGFTFTIRCICYLASFLLWIHLFIPSGVISPLCSIAYQTLKGLGASSFHVISLCLFILFTGLSKQECWSGLPISSPGDSILSEFLTMTHPSQVAPHSLAHSLVELHEGVIHAIFFGNILWWGFHSIYPLVDEDKRLVEASWWEELTVRETGCCTDGQGHARWILNAIFCLWMRLYSLSVVWSEGAQS